ncbi:family 35 glycosyl hydrolase [Pseudovirgaria hyperparasitica]|uniref:Beta-galactosidase n=1 Tax=Pseudovirgaria hyperparasitica TaxID=470096 RepID=A0A6A6WI87_9PEZI|nr:family 35 glycosyl hydrolase [Pseudovirgaria hyperparasitica]KAF2761706.1 family 35 glycosyl hydrolase [Pseudovirgaria hyperparasitica]
MLFSFSALQALLLAFFAVRTASIAIGRNPNDWIAPYKRGEVLQDIVTWDDKSIFINGERVLLFSGEIHPFRLPVPSLWPDILQKIKALGYNCVSVYIDWALHEGKPGDFSAEGVFAWEPFFDAAKEAGIYVLARPGPYINAEVSGGGFPGWLQRVPGVLRDNDTAYMEATNNYVQKISEIVAKAQITNGGPVILLQPENEYQSFIDGFPFPNFNYWDQVKDQYRKAGIVVPFISNEAYPAGYITPTTEADIDIYGHDGYPLGFDCANPTVWPDGKLPSDWWNTHLRLAPSTPFSLVEFQGGAFDPWGGNGFDKCLSLLNQEFERVFYKNNYGYGVTIFNIYMTWGGTNWGNLGHPGGYTSYDYGAVVDEMRLVNREKYSEAKLEATFLHSSPAYLVADRINGSTSWTTSPDIIVFPATTETTKFYFTRHTKYNSLDSTSYKLHVSTASYGNITIPQLNNSLSLNGRDAKVHVSDYSVGDFNIVYSSAEVYTWKKYNEKTVLVVYGGPNEQHELAIEDTSEGYGSAETIEGSGVAIAQKTGYTVLNWATSSERKVVKTPSGLYVYLLDRNEAYNYWVPATPASYGQGSLIVKAGYLIRSAVTDGTTLSLIGDLNVTTPIEIIGGAPQGLTDLQFNGESLDFKQDDAGVVTATAEFKKPTISIPDLGAVEWKYIDSLPEIKADYSDETWPDADLEKTYNDKYEQLTPTSLFAGDYSFHSGSLVFRGHFKANGQESSLTINTQGGSAYGHSIWLGDKFVGSWEGNDVTTNYTSTNTLPNLSSGQDYVLTVVIDHMGYDENYVVGEDEMKTPRGILDYTLSGHDKSDVTWKITGNLGGEDYVDRARGPLNEGALFVERQGYHLPAPPADDWETSEGPTTGISAAGVGFFSTSFDLDMPDGYDIPLSFVFTNETESAYRVQLFVNGWQFGKYVHNVGPQRSFPVPEGILDYHGTNWVGLSLWALEADGAKVEKVELVPQAVIQTGFGKVENAPLTKWEKREGAY